MANSASLFVSDIQVEPNKSCSIFNSDFLVIAPATPTILTFDSELFDTDIMHDNVVNNSRITIKTKGLYFILGYVRFLETTLSFNCTLTVLINGAFYRAAFLQKTTTSNVIFSGFVSGIDSRNVNDVLELQLEHNAGSNLTLLPGSPGYSFEVARIAA